MVLTDLVGLILPAVIDLVNKNIANEKLRFLVAMLICGGVATLLNLDKLQSGDWNDLLGKAGIVFAEAQVVYKLYWKESSVRENLNLTK